MRIIGITGGIGAGKSTVCRILSDFGIVIIDADKISREIVKKGESAYYEIVDRFGCEILDEENELDRKKLAGIVFEDSKKLRALNKITHKYISDRIIHKIKELGDTKDFVVVDAAIPIESIFENIVDETWVMVADMEIRAKRVMERNNMSYEEVKSRINAQLRDDEYIKRADRIIYNNSSYEQLKTDLYKILKEIQGDRS